MRARRRARPRQDAARADGRAGARPQFSRVQFTPDLMPSDITGTEIMEEDTRRAARVPLRAGPMFAQHRAGRRDQSRPAEDAGRAAAGHAGAQRHRRRPARTSCPRRSSCSPRRTRSSRKARTPLPEAQLDRFMFELRVGYPTTRRRSRSSPARRATTEGEVKPVLGGEELLALQRLVRRLPAPPSLVQYAVQARAQHAPGRPPTRRRR